VPKRPLTSRWEAAWGGARVRVASAPRTGTCPARHRLFGSCQGFRGTQGGSPFVGARWQRAGHAVPAAPGDRQPGSKGVV